GTGGASIGRGGSRGRATSRSRPASSTTSSRRRGWESGRCGSTASASRAISPAPPSCPTSAAFPESSPTSPEAGLYPLPAACLDGGGYRIPGLLRLHHHQIPGPLDDRADQPLRRPVRELDPGGAVVELLDHRSLLSQPSRPLRGDPDPGDAGRPHLAPHQPLLLGEALLDPLARLEPRPRRPRLPDPVEPEVAGVVAGEVVAAQVPALGSADELVGLDLAFGELVLVLLVVVELEDPPGPDRIVDGRHDLRVVAPGGDLEALLG